MRRRYAFATDIRSPADVKSFTEQFLRTGHCDPTSNSPAVSCIAVSNAGRNSVLYGHSSCPKLIADTFPGCGQSDASRTAAYAVPH